MPPKPIATQPTQPEPKKLFQNFAFTALPSLSDLARLISVESHKGWQLAGPITPLQILSFKWGFIPRWTVVYHVTLYRVEEVVVPSPPQG